MEAEVEGAAPTEGEGDGDGEGEGEGEAVLMEEDLIQQSLDDYDAGRYSPRLLTAHELPLDAHVLEPDEDLQRLQLSRQQLQVTGKGGASGSSWGRGWRCRGRGSSGLISWGKPLASMGSCSILVPRVSEHPFSHLHVPWGVHSFILGLLARWPWGHRWW